MSTKFYLGIFTIATCSLLTAVSSKAEIVNAGAGSYTTEFPGVDQAGRNGYPTSTPYVSGTAATRPVPSNDWWSSKLTTPSPNNMFNYPLGIKTPAEGLVMLRGIIGQALPAENPVTIGVAGLVSESPVTVSDHTDWTVTFAWEKGAKKMEAIAGIGMPMVYFSKNTDDAVTVKVSTGTISVNDNIVVIANSYNRASYAIYAPAGSSWTREGNILSSTLGGKRYWTVAMLPDNTTDAAATAARWADYAFAFPANTEASWVYDQPSGTVTTTYKVSVDSREGNPTMLMGLLPHHWAHIDDSAPVSFTGDTYSTARGEMKMIAANEFKTSLKFHGILPTLPVTGSEEYGYSQSELVKLINKVIANNGLSNWTDSYNDGQLFNRLVQTARIAHEAGLTDLYNSLRSTIKAHLEKWLTCKEGDVAFLFYYYKPWGAMLGYPAGHGQDNNLNDHHFHWGYLIHAAAFLAQDDPQWGADWGPMINLLIRDAASTMRDDPMFPYQRAFSPYAGHCWANGTATSGPGNDQESTSEAMQFHSALIHWGEVTGNSEIRDLGVYMYATEQSAVEEYWFDVEHRNFASGYSWPIASRVFTNGYDIQNFWGGGIQGSYGIELYPIHGGSFYLMQHPEWADNFRQAIERDTPLLLNDNDPNTWHDVYWQYIAMMNAPYAINLYNNHPGRTLKFGVSAAQTYQWIHSLSMLGRPCLTLTADYPIATAFDLGETRTYAVNNYGNHDINVSFSDGFTMTAPAGKLSTAKGPSPEPWSPGEVTPDDPDSPDNPGGGNGGDNDESACTFVDTESTEGSFAGEYTVAFNTVGNDVEVTARFDGEYIGPVAYIFNETHGFYEINMTSQGNQTFSGKITGLSQGEKIKIRVKLAFAGGLAVTRYLYYIVGQNCSSGIDKTILGDNDFKVWPNPAIATDNIEVEINSDKATLTVWNMCGQQIMSRSISRRATIDTSTWAPGNYFLRVETPSSVAVKKLIMR